MAISSYEAQEVEYVPVPLCLRTKCKCFGPMPSGPQIKKIRTLSLLRTGMSSELSTAQSQLVIIFKAC